MIDFDNFFLSIRTARTVWRISAYFFFANRQLFLKISKNYKKIDFGRFLMHILLYEGTMRDRVKNASEGYLYG